VDDGFMSVRLQTWFPFSIQRALNGREWLRRSLNQERIEFGLHGNKFLHLADYARAQQLLAARTAARWVELLSGFLPLTCPPLRKTLGAHLSDYWTLWQSEWATDYVFEKPGDLNPLMDALLPHALMTGTRDRGFRYMGRPVNVAGQPHPLANPEVLTRANVWHEGVRIRHWVDRNSVKLYNEHNNLRAEMTMNHPAMFRVYRHPEGQKHSGVKNPMALRKGLADIAVRTQVAADINHRFMEHIAALQDETPLRDALQAVTHSTTHNGRKTRALDVTGKDRELSSSILNMTFRASPIKAYSGNCVRHLGPKAEPTNNSPLDLAATSACYAIMASFATCPTNESTS
jgi:hypothetical protein